MKKQANEKLCNLIEKKYGGFTLNTMKCYFLEEFFVSSRGRKIDELDYYLIIDEIAKLVDAQGLSLEDVDYLGFGQKYTTLGIGNAVLKIGNTTEKIYDNPFRLAPVYKCNSKTDLGIYVSQRAKCGNITEKDVQKMYNAIREAGGLWLDVKDENLGFVDEKMDFSSVYPDQEEINIVQDKKFPPYNGRCFVLDYEDVLFLTPKLREQMLKFEAPGINSVPREMLLEGLDDDTIYFDGFIKNSNVLLEYERNYQRQKGNRAQEKRCVAALRENNRNIRQARYVQEQRYRYDRNCSDIGAQFSVKEIGMQVMQKTNFHRLQEMAGIIRNKMKSIITFFDIENLSGKCDNIKVAEPVQVSKKEQPNNSYTAKSTNPTDMCDPYSTR